MRSLALAIACLIWGGLLVGCSSNSTPVADLVRTELGPGREGGTGDGPGGGDRRVDGKIKADLPKPPTHWVLSPGATQPLTDAPMVAFLQNGDVLIAGGDRPKTTSSGWEWSYTDDAYRYVAATDAFETAGKLQVARGWATATVMKDGRVLIVGGESDAAYGDPSVDIYDPTAKTWSKGKQMPKERYGHGAVLLADGKVLVGGGCAWDQTTDSFISYDPAADTWSTLATVMSTQRCGHTMTMLPNGKILIAGGLQGPNKFSAWSAYMDSLEIFDPNTGTITASTAKLSNPRAYHLAVLMQDGRVLFDGGTCSTWSQNCSSTPKPAWCTACDNWVSRADIYDPTTDKMTALAEYGDTDSNQAGHALMADGRVLLAGGQGAPERTVAFSSSSGGSWTQLPDLNKPRSSAHAVTLLDGTILLVGGYTKDVGGGMPNLPPAERFVP
jgi:large repetitive protein